MRYSETTGCFYPEDCFYPDLPSDIITVPQEDFSLAMSKGLDEKIEVVGGRITLAPMRTTEEQLAFEMGVVWAQIKTERDNRKAGGFKIEVSPGVFKWFHSDEPSRIQQLGLMMAGASVPAIPWKTMDGSFVTMSPAVAAAIFQQAFVLDAALFTIAEQHKAAMEASSDPADYDFLTGWPERFADAV